MLAGKTIIHLVECLNLNPRTSYHSGTPSCLSFSSPPLQSHSSSVILKLRARQFRVISTVFSPKRLRQASLSDYQKILLIVTGCISREFPETQHTYLKLLHITPLGAELFTPFFTCHMHQTKWLVNNNHKFKIMIDYLGHLAIMFDPHGTVPRGFSTLILRHPLPFCLTCPSRAINNRSSRVSYNLPQ